MEKLNLSLNSYISTDIRKRPIYQYVQHLHGNAIPSIGGSAWKPATSHAASFAGIAGQEKASYRYRIQLFFFTNRQRPA
jgi:hypothetical protein